MTTYQAILRDAAVAVIQSREYCGDENEALRQWQHDYPYKLSENEKFLVWESVDKMWDEFKNEAKGN